MDTKDGQSQSLSTYCFKCDASKVNLTKIIEAVCIKTVENNKILQLDKTKQTMVHFLDKSFDQPGLSEWIDWSRWSPTITIQMVQVGHVVHLVQVDQVNQVVRVVRVMF